MTLQDTFREAYRDVALKVHKLLSFPGARETFGRHFKEYKERSSGKRRNLTAKYTRLAVLHGLCFPDEAIDPLIISDSCKYNKTWSVATPLAWSADNDKNRAGTIMDLEADLADVEADLEANAPGQDEGEAKAVDEPQGTPKTNPQLIYQSDGAEFYNIPKSTLSKAANKEPGEPGYLWSGHTGRRVFYRRADLQKISRSRQKLGG